MSAIEGWCVLSGDVAALAIPPSRPGASSDCDPQLHCHEKYLRMGFGSIYSPAPDGRSEEAV